MDGQVTSLEPAAERLYNYSAAEMIGQPLWRDTATRTRATTSRGYLPRCGGGAPEPPRDCEKRPRRDEFRGFHEPGAHPRPRWLHRRGGRGPSQHHRAPAGASATSRRARTLLEASVAHRPMGGWTSGVVPNAHVTLDERGVPDIRRGGASTEFAPTSSRGSTLATADAFRRPKSLRSAGDHV